MAVRTLGEYRGRQELFQKQSPEVLETLKRVAMVQSPVDLVDGWVPDQYQVFYKMAAPFW